MHINETTLQTWFERDRQYVGLVDKATEQNTIIEFWDDDVTDMVESGYLEPRNMHRSLYDYALEMGVL